MEIGKSRMTSKVIFWALVEEYISKWSDIFSGVQRMYADDHELFAVHKDAKVDQSRLLDTVGIVADWYEANNN